MTHFGSGIWSYSRRSTGAIFLVTVPATIIRSDCRGEARKTSAPNRAMSYRDAEAAIISIAQHARPNPIGQMDDSRAQLSTRSMLVVMKLSSNRWSMRPMDQMIYVNVLVVLALAAQSRQSSLPRMASGGGCDPVLAGLFTPARPELGRYEVC